MKSPTTTRKISTSAIAIQSAFTLLLILFYGCQSKSTEEPFLFGKGHGIGNVTLMVNDLASAIKYYEDTLGFTIPGDGAAGPFDESVSVSIRLGDMTGFEILSISDSADQTAVPTFISDYLETNQGVRLFSLISSSVDSTYLSLAEQAFHVDSVHVYRTTAPPEEGWSRDDGSPQQKVLDFDKQHPPGSKPRFSQSISTDYATLQKEWNTYYTYGRMFRNHANGVLGISAIKVAANDLRTVAAEYDKMGFQAIESNDDLVRYAIFRHQELHLVATQSDPALADFHSGADGVFAIQFDVLNLDSTYQFFQAELPSSALIKTSDKLIIEANYAFGVQLEFVQEPEEQLILAKKLTPAEKLDTLGMQYAGELFTKYCTLCHGENREGYAADHAPSLRSKSLLSTSMNSNFMRYTMQFGRANTAMAGYLDTQGGPLEYIEIELLLAYLQQMAGVEEPVALSREPVLGDINSGADLYSKNCVTCHGAKGEGVTAPALANPMLLATATDHFLRYAIAEGRDGTPMFGFKDQLSDAEIDDLTAFLRSRASGWDIPQLDTVRVPTPEEYVLNPDGEAPVFQLREDMFVSSEQVSKALEEGKRMIILDARSEVAWRQMHIPGAVPVPYYEEPENFIDYIPNDGTQIVIYCACPHAASRRVQGTLTRFGYRNTAIIDEGILVWAQMGFPVRNGS